MSTLPQGSILAINRGNHLVIETKQSPFSTDKATLSAPVYIEYMFRTLEQKFLAIPSHHLLDVTATEDELVVTIPNPLINHPTIDKKTLEQLLLSVSEIIATVPTHVQIVLPIDGDTATDWEKGLEHTQQIASYLKDHGMSNPIDSFVSLRPNQAKIKKVLYQNPINVDIVIQKYYYQ